MAHGAVEEQRVALVQRVDGPVKLDLDGPPDDVDEHLTRRGLDLVRPRPRTARPLPHAQGRPAPLADRAGGVRAAVWDPRAIVRADHACGCPRRRPKRSDRDVEGLGDPFNGAHARPREPALELAEERMREVRLAAQRLQGQSAVAAELPHPRAKHGDRVRRRLVHPSSRVTPRSPCAGGPQADPRGTRPWRAGRVPRRPALEGRRWSRGRRDLPCGTTRRGQPRRPARPRLLPEGPVLNEPGVRHGAAALAALEPAALVRDAAAILRIPSVTGDERPVLEALAELALARRLAPDLHAHDLEALRAPPGHPGEEAPREELWGLTGTLPGTAPGRIALNGHVDVVAPGTVPWRHGAWSGVVDDGRLHGRGAVDMKAAVVA